VRGDIPIDSKILLVTDFVNLKIKLIQSFKSAHRDRVCVCAFIEISAHRGRMYVCVHRNEYSYMYEYHYLYCVSKNQIVFFLKQ
jgi:hypothetical protein